MVKMGRHVPSPHIPTSPVALFDTAGESVASIQLSQHLNPHSTSVTSAIETTFQIHSRSYKLGHRNILKYLKQV